MKRTTAFFFILFAPISIFGLGPKGGSGGNISPNADLTVSSFTIKNQLLVGETTAISTFTPTAFTLDDGVAFTANGAVNQFGNSTQVSTNLKIDGLLSTNVSLEFGDGGTSKATILQNNGTNALEIYNPGTIVFNQNNTTSSTRFESGTAGTDALYVDQGATVKVGIGNSAPGDTLHVTGSVTVTSSATITGPIAISSSVLTGYTPAADVMVTNTTTKAGGTILVSGGTPSIQYAVDVGSVTDVTAGTVRVNFARDFADTNYFCVAITSGAHHISYTSKIAHSIDFLTTETTLGNAQDNVSFMFQCSGDN